MGPETAALALAVPGLAPEVLVQRLLRPVPDDEGALTDPLTGAVPSSLHDEEPIYLEAVRDLGIPGYLTSTASDVIKGEVIVPDPSEEKILTPARPPRKRTPKKTTGEKAS